MADHAAPLATGVVGRPGAAVDAPPLTVSLPLSEVGEAGVGEDGHRHQDQQQAKLAVGLLQGVQQGLQA